MHFRQKRARYKTSFDFAESELTYTFDNIKGKVGATIPYHSIPDIRKFKQGKMWQAKYYMIFALVACLILATHALSIHRYGCLIGVAIFAFMPCAVFIVDNLFCKPVGMTSIQANPAIIVLHDGQEKALLDAIAQRRVEAIRRKLAQVDFNKPYYEEARKFRWLKEESIISEQEFQHARQKIAAMRDKAALSTPTTTNLN